jgi:hypothetical protein
MKIVELILDEEQDNFIEAISVVENPAIEKDFIALKDEQKKYEFAEIDTEQKILVGPILIPNKPIYRKNKTEEYTFILAGRLLKKLHSYI